MISLWMTISISGERRRFFRLWLPLFLVWPLLLPFAILLLPFVVLALLLVGRNGFAMPVALWRLVAGLKGTLVDVANPNGTVFIRIL